MRLRLAAAVALAALLSSDVKADSWESRRDRIQSAAEEGERRRHPWAGVYAAYAFYHPFATLCLAPSGDFFAASYDAERRKTGQAAGRVADDGGALRLSTTTLKGRLGAHAAGAYQVLRWGDVRCLLHPGDEPHFLDCMAQRCEHSFLCTRGLLYGHPTFSPELEKARLVHPQHRAFKVEDIGPPMKRSWGLLYRVRIAGGAADGFKKEDRLYWSDDDAWLLLTDVGERSSIGDLQLPYAQRFGRPGPGVRPGSSVYRWTLRYELPEFLRDTAKVTP